jgi:hypothetical protein
MAYTKTIASIYSNDNKYIYTLSHSSGKTEALLNYAIFTSYVCVLLYAEHIIINVCVCEYPTMYMPLYIYISIYNAPMLFTSDT